MKKSVSIILSILLVMLSCFSPAFAGEEEAGLYINEHGDTTSDTGIDTISTSDGSTAVNLFSEDITDIDEYVLKESDEVVRSCVIDEENKYNDKSTVKWNTKGSNSQVLIDVTDDITQFNTVNVEIYSPKVTDDTIGIHFHASGPYATKTITIDWEGWKTIQIPMSDYSSISLSEVVSFQMWDHGWSYTFGDAVSGSDKAGSLNLGKIWLDNSGIAAPDEPDNPPVAPDEPDEPDVEENDGEHIIVKYDSGFAFGGKLSKDTENVYEQDASAKWDVTAGNDFGYDISGCDFNDYSFVYATVYSPKSTGSVIMFQYLFEGTGYAVSNIPLNFEGWKTLAFSISDLGIGSNKVKRVNVYNNGWNNKIEGIEYVNFERIGLSKYDISKCEIIEESLVDGYNRVSPVGFEAFVKTTSKLDAEVAPEVTLKSAGGKTVETSYEVKGSKLTLKATETLDYGESYTLTVNNITDKNGNSCSYSADFSTHSKAVTALTPELKENGGKITAVSTASNPTSGDEDALIWICEYSKDGELVNSVCETVSVESGKDAELKAELTLKSSENKVEAFVTDSTGKPAMPFVAVYSEESYAITPSVGGTDELTIDSESVSCYGVKADVSLKSEFISPVVAYVKDSDGKVVYAKAVMTDAEGKASFDVLLSADALTSGKYTFSVYSENSTQNPGFEFYFADTNERSAVFGSVSKATTVSAIEDIISENCQAFNYSEELMETNKTAKFLAEVVDGNESESFEALCELMDKALLKRDEVNTCDWNKLADIIEENYDILLCSDYEPAFSKLTSEQKAKVAKKLKENCPYSLFSYFASDLEEFIDDVKSEKKNNSSGGGGGGGSSGGSSYSVPVAPFGANAPSDQITGNALPFNDLASASWAQGSIVELYNAGVISPSADGKFRPEDTVTREEFAKLICAAFELEDSSASCSFADVYPDAWYYTYIASMNSKGIITGYGETFGTGNNITREDMAVIAMRALRHMGISLDSGVYASFADEADVSSYALDAVYALKNAGIINGIGNGSFAPGSNATRAEAAKIINGLMELTAKEAAHNG